MSSKVHFISIGGSVMHSLAISLVKSGYQITGSDDKIYDPSLTRLKKYDILPNELGWFPEKISNDLDFVILGMHAKNNNPELLRAQELNLNIVSYPEFIYNYSKNKTRIVIGGSHGKTTITSMILHVLNDNNFSIDYVLGAQLEGFDNTVSLSTQNEFILIEGDEYLSSPVDLTPKFHKYKANIALISGISWDHVNVFDNPEFYAKQFDLFIDSIVDGGVLIFNELDSLLSDIVKDNNSYIRKIEYNLPEHSVSNNNVFIKTSEGNIPLQVFGEHNLSNIEAAKKICSLLGVLDDDFYNSISTFKGATKRLEIIYKGLNNLLIRDFAHSPSKLKASVNAVRGTFSNKFLIAVFELHTFSSLDPKFIQQYSGCLDNCDLPIIFLDNNNKKIQNSESINENVISSAFNIKNLIIIKSNIDLLNYLTSLKYDNACLLLMSSGNFGLLDLDDIKKYMNNES